MAVHFICVSRGGCTFFIFYVWVDLGVHFLFKGGGGWWYVEI